MCISPQPFFWDTIARRCWPGAHRLISQIAFGRRGIGCPKFGGKLTFRPNLGYFSTCEKNWLREEYKGRKRKASEASDALDQGHSGGVTPTRTLHNAEPKGLQLIRSLVGRPNRQAIILLVYPAWSNGPGGGVR